MKLMKRKRFPAGSYLFHHGDTADSGFLLIGGLVELSVPQEGDEAVILGVAQRGELIGALSLIDGSHRRSADARAVKDCEAYVVPHDTLRGRLSRMDPSLRLLMQQLARTIKTDGQVIVKRRRPRR